MYFTRRSSSLPRLGGSDQVAAGAPVVERQLRAPREGVADVGELRRLDHPGRDELDALAGAEAEAGIEQTLAVTEQHWDDVQLELVEQPGGQYLAQQLPAAGHRHVLAAGGLPGQVERPLDAVGDKRERRATLALEHLPGAMGDNEHRGPEGRVVTPGDLAGVEH